MKNVILFKHAGPLIYLKFCVITQYLRRHPICTQILKYCSHLSNHKWTEIKSHNHPLLDDNPVSSEVTYFASKLHKGSASTWSTKQTEHTWSRACTILVHFQVMNNFISCTMHPQHFLQISKCLQYSADSQCQISILNHILQIASILPRLLLRPQISTQLIHNKDDRWSRLVKQPKWQSFGHSFLWINTNIVFN